LHPPEEVRRSAHHEGDALPIESTDVLTDSHYWCFRCLSAAMAREERDEPRACKAKKTVDESRVTSVANPGDLPEF
jgi:hypothetical protein